MRLPIGRRGRRQRVLSSSVMSQSVCRQHSGPDSGQSRTLGALKVGLIFTLTRLPKPTAAYGPEFGFQLASELDWIRKVTIPPGYRSRKRRHLDARVTRGFVIVSRLVERQYQHSVIHPQRNQGNAMKQNVLRANAERPGLSRAVDGR